MVSETLRNGSRRFFLQGCITFGFLNGQSSQSLSKTSTPQSTASTGTNVGTVTNRTLGNLAYGNGNFIVVGYGGFAMSSPDLAAWKENRRRRQGGLTLQDVSFGSGIFVAWETGE